MKTIIGILLLIGISLNGYGQLEIGKTLDQVKQIYPANQYQVSQDITTNGIIRYGVVHTSYVELFLFNATIKKCAVIYIIPGNEYGFQFHIKEFNKNYTVIVPNKIWNTANLNFDIKIELTTQEIGELGSKRCFVITPI
jgi:hypothetical protein